MLQTNYCTVKQNMGMISEDTPGDSDRLPDFTNINGKVIFTPTTAPGNAYQVINEDGEAYTVPVASVEADIVNGRIFHEGQEGILLFAAGKNATPEKIVYRVTYSGLRAGGVPVGLSTIFFEAVPGAVIDLTRVTPVPGAPVAGTTKGDKGDPGPAATIVSHEALPSGDVQVEFSDGTVITVPSGETPYVKDGNWWIGEQDTGVVADGVDQVRNALAEQISTIESNAERAELAAAGTESAISRNASKGQQMIVNGNGQLGGDYWPSSVNVVWDDVPLGAYASWERPGAQAVVWHDLPVVIDPSHPTYMSGFFRQAADTTASVYLALAPVDQDGQTISALNVMYVEGTLTKLAQDLKPGDTKVYLESAENWANTGTGNSNKRMIFWDHVSKNGKVWAPETYSRNVSGAAWEAGGINYDENTITLLKPWSSATIPAGTPLSNGNNGANYMYAKMSGSVGSSWEKLEGTVQGGIDLSGKGFSPGRGWPPGVAAVLPGVLINYGSNQRVSNNRFANVYLSQLAPLGHTHKVSDISDIKVDTSVGTRVFMGDTMIFGDTGKRLLHDENNPPTTGSGTVRIHRVGDTVSLSMFAYRVGEGTTSANTLFTIPEGFRPEHSIYSHHVVDRDFRDTTHASLDIHSLGMVSVIGSPTGRLYLNITWITADPWPTSLPVADNS